MSDDTKRDAAADLAVCAAATPGLNDVMPGSITDWDYANSTYTTEFMCNRRVSREQVQNDLQLFAIAGVALPHWIERAVRAEAEAERLRQCDSNALRCLGEQMKLAGELLSGCHDAYSALTRGVVGMERSRAVAALGAVINEAMKAKGGTS